MAKPHLLSLGRQVKILAAMEELASSTAEPIAHIINTFDARVEVGWGHSVPTVGAVKRMQYLEQIRKIMMIPTDQYGYTHHKNILLIPRERSMIYGLYV